MAVAIDTLAYARRLREAGFTQQQAEGQAEALAAAMTDSLATKQDIRELDTRLVELENRVVLRMDELEKRMTLRFENQDARFGASLGDLERRMTMRLGGIMVAGIGVTSALVKLL